MPAPTSTQSGDATLLEQTAIFLQTAQAGETATQRLAEVNAATAVLLLRIAVAVERCAAALEAVAPPPHP